MGLYLQRPSPSLLYHSLLRESTVEKKPGIHYGFSHYAHLSPTPESDLA